MRLNTRCWVRDISLGLYPGGVYVESLLVYLPKVITVLRNFANAPKYQTFAERYLSGLISRRCLLRISAGISTILLEVSFIFLSLQTGMVTHTRNCHCTVNHTIVRCSKIFDAMHTVKLHTNGWLCIVATSAHLTFRGPCIVIYSYNKTNDMH